MNDISEKILIDALDRLEQGVDIETVLSSYPEQAAELRPYLETTALMSGLASQPTVAAQQQSQADFLAAAAAMRSPQAVPAAPWFSLRRLVMPLASLAMIMLLLGFSLIMISASALPGDGLYGLKRGVEDFRLRLAGDPERILHLSQQFREERISEIEALLRAGQAADVAFEGEIEALEPAVWYIAGLPVELEADTLVEGTPMAGELARVEGRTDSGRLIARSIVVLTGTPQDDPLPDAERTPEPTATPQPESTPPARPLPLGSFRPAPEGLPPANDGGAAVENENMGQQDDQLDHGDEMNENDGATDDNNQNGPDSENQNDNVSDPGEDSNHNENSGGNENEDDGDKSGESSGGGDGDNINDGSGDNTGDNGDSDQSDNDSSDNNDSDSRDDNNNDAGDSNDNDAGDSNDNDGGDNNDNDGGDNNDNDGGDDSDNDNDSSNDNSDNDGGEDNSNDNSGGDDDSKDNDNKGHDQDAQSLAAEIAS